MLYSIYCNLPADWKKDMKQTVDKDGISYSFERKDKKITCMVCILADIG
jgi:hypothetical protein